jgi:hypothetical protein
MALRYDVDLFQIERTKKKEIKNCKKFLKNLKHYWDSIGLVTSYYNTWSK